MNCGGVRTQMMSRKPKKKMATVSNGTQWHLGSQQTVPDIMMKNVGKMNCSHCRIWQNTVPQESDHKKSSVLYKRMSNGQIQFRGNLTRAQMRKFREANLSTALWDVYDTYDSTSDESDDDDVPDYYNYDMSDPATATAAPGSATQSNLQTYKILMFLSLFIRHIVLLIVEIVTVATYKQKKERKKKVLIMTLIDCVSLLLVLSVLCLHWGNIIDLSTNIVGFLAIGLLAISHLICLHAFDKTYLILSIVASSCFVLLVGVSWCYQYKAQK